VRPSWRFLLLLGLIGGGPTFVGTLIGQAWVSESLSILFLALAAGSILFVVLELAAVNRRMASKHFIAWFVLLGLLLGFATEFVVEAAGV
jgi:ZIP family zinc transporter